MSSKTYTPIDCGDYDYLEIACMDNYDLEIVMDKNTIHAKAITTENNDTGEFLIVELKDGQRQALRADAIQKLIVLSNNARFREHVFSQTNQFSQDK